tara:strand:- start:9 stop:275 length:267 start_codon:yes stop_codon:yes gene_type:complete
MSIHKKFEKFWSGSVSFTATETFKDLDTAVKASVPSTAAKIVIDEKTISYDFNRMKEVSNPNDNTLSTPGKRNPGERKGEKKVEQTNK